MEGNVIRFPGAAPLSFDDAMDIDLEALDRDALAALLPRLNDLYDRLLAQEPDEDSDELEDWEARLEAIDDLLEDVGDLLDG